MKYYLPILLLCSIAFTDLNAQNSVDSTSKTPTKEFKSIEEALKNPKNVYRLNLSNQNLNMLADSIWVKFENLEYLSLGNDHLKELPTGIGFLKNLKVLDVSGNDFKELPESFSRLENLRELYLNDEKRMDVDQSLSVIKNLPKLKILHLENDHLRIIPKGLVYLTHLETLYLNNNEFKEVPVELKDLKNLKYIDMHDNKIKLDNQDMNQPGFGVRIGF